MCDIPSFVERASLMKKVLIALLGLTSVSAMASEVTLYGKVSVGLEYDSFPSNTQVQPGNSSVQNYGSYFGIRGTDQVYGETAAIWQVENLIDIASGEAYQKTKGSNWVPNHPGSLVSGQAVNGMNVLASSDSYLGLQGAWGRIRFGNLSNTYRTNSGGVDIFKGNNANSFGNYDRVMQVLEQTVRYDSPTWSNLSFSGYVSMNQNGDFNTGAANGNGMNQSGDMNGYNNAPVFGWGVFYQPGNFGITWNNQINMNTGIYQEMGGTQPGFGPGATAANPNTVSQGINAFSSRLEISYNDPDGLFIGAGGQITQGFNWQVVPGNGNMNNLWVQQQAINNVNSNYVGTCANNWCPLTTANMGTAEAGFAIGWHIMNWMPKVGYMYGSNLMNGGSPWDLINGNNQIGGTGYNQVVAELDWNITPKTISFISMGQTWWGNTQNSMIKGKNPGNSGNYDMNAAGGSININNATIALGLSHVF